MKILFVSLCPPFRILDHSPPRTLTLLSGVLLVSLYLNSMYIISSASIVLTCFWLCVWTIVMAGIMDFFAQLLGCASRLLVLVRWFILSYMPCLLLQPIGLLEGVVSPLFLSLATLFILASISTTQLNILKHIYGLSTFKSLCLWISPLVSLLGLGTMIVLSVGSFATML